MPDSKETRIGGFVLDGVGRFLHHQWLIYSVIGGNGIIWFVIKCIEKLTAGSLSIKLFDIKSIIFIQW